MRPAEFGRKLLHHLKEAKSAWDVAVWLFGLGTIGAVGTWIAKNWAATATSITVEVRPLLAAILGVLLLLFALAVYARKRQRTICAQAAALAVCHKEKAQADADLAAARNPNGLQPETITVLRYVSGGGERVKSASLESLYSTLPELKGVNLLRHLERLTDLGYIAKLETKGGTVYMMDARGREFLSRSGML